MDKNRNISISVKTLILPVIRELFDTGVCNRVSQWKIMIQGFNREDYF